MRLIDADALMKKIREVDFVADVDLMKITHDSMLTGFFHGSVQGIVDRLPTAYDPDKIVEQLEDKAELTYLNKMEERVGKKQTTGFALGIRAAIEIAKGGAV